MMWRGSVREDRSHRSETMRFEVESKICKERRLIRSSDGVMAFKMTGRFGGVASQCMQKRYL